MALELPTASPGLPWRGTIVYLAEGTALLVALGIMLQRPDAGGFVTAGVVASMIYAAAVDLLTMRLPNVITYSGILVMLIAAAVAGTGTLASAGLGVLIGGGLLGLVAAASRGQVGLGDVKLSAMGGAVVGHEYVLPGLLIGTASALPVAGVLLLLRRISRRQAIPYGPYLCFGFVVVTLVAGSVLTR